MHKASSRRQTPLQFRFRNIGPVKNAELELGDLTVIAGRNNTGKTYIVYTLYGLLKMFRSWTWPVLRGDKQHEAEFPNWDRLATELAGSGQCTLPLDYREFSRQRKWVIQRLTQKFSVQGLSDSFSSQHEVFRGSSIDVISNFEESGFQHSYHRGRVTIEYDGTEAVVVIDDTPQEWPPAKLTGYIAHHYMRFLLDGLFPDPFILSAERFGISLFYRELDFTKNQLVDLLQKIGDNKKRDRVSSYRFIDKATSRYALPIKDNIDYTRSIPDLRSRKSKLHEHKLFNDIKDMMGGYYGSSDNDIRFISKARGKERSFNIPLHLASSSVRGLSDFYFYLRHVARSLSGIGSLEARINNLRAIPGL